MIGALMVIAMAAGSCWWIFSGVRSPQGMTAPVPAPLRSVAGETTALGPDEDPDQWRATGGAWTALDERQLIRLLTESAPINRPATNAIDNAVPEVEHVEHTDTP